MEKRLCAACRQLFSPRPQVPRQSYCRAAVCQRERRRRWQEAKLRTDPDYRENQRSAQKAWCRRNSDYWREYRRTHHEYRERNKAQQRVRNRNGAKPKIAKMDSSLPTLESVDDEVGVSVTCWRRDKPKGRGTRAGGTRYARRPGTHDAPPWPIALAG